VLTNGAGLVTSEASVVEGMWDDIEDQAPDVIDCGVERLDWRESFLELLFVGEAPSC